MNIEDNTNATKRDALGLLVDQHIGSGSMRAVWTSKLCPDDVIKIEDGAQCWQNIMEWQVWNCVKGTKHEKWFAPCKHISPDGLILVMAKTTVPGMSDLPEKMPYFLCDFKRSNYGMLNGQIVCHDYGLSWILQAGLTGRMKKANWHDNVQGTL